MQQTQSSFEPNTSNQNCKRRRSVTQTYADARRRNNETLSDLSLNIDHYTMEICITIITWAYFDNIVDVELQKMDCVIYH